MKYCHYQENLEGQSERVEGEGEGKGGMRGCHDSY